MNDLRELGLPSDDQAPMFPFHAGVLGQVDRRIARRRRRRHIAAGGGLVALAVSGALTIHPTRANQSLEQDQPAHVNVGPSQAPPPASPVPSRPSDRADSAESTATGPPRPAGPVAQPTALTADNQAPVNRAGPADATPVHRERTTYGGESCRLPVNGWGATGWCFFAADVSELTAGHTITLAVSLCRNGPTAGQVSFPARQQAAWWLHQDGRWVWGSNAEPSPFTAGEVVTLQPQQCLRWRIDWRVTSHGRPVATGDYQLLWSTGADLRDPRGHGYHDQFAVHVMPPS